MRVVNVRVTLVAALAVALISGGLATVNSGAVAAENTSPISQSESSFNGESQPPSADEKAPSEPADETSNAETDPTESPAQNQEQLPGEDTGSLEPTIPPTGTETNQLEKSDETPGRTTNTTNEPTVKEKSTTKNKTEKTTQKVPTTQGNFKVSEPTKIGWGWQQRQAFKAGQLRPGGQNDIFRITENGNLYLYRRSAPTVFQSSSLAGWGWQNLLHVLGGIDFNGDQINDILGISADGKMHLYYGYRDGSVGSRREIGKGWGSADALVALPLGPGGKPAVLAQFGTELRLYSTDGRGKWLGYTPATLPQTSGLKLGKTVALADITGTGFTALGRLLPSGKIEILHTVDGKNFTTAGELNLGAEPATTVGATGFGRTRSGTIDLVNSLGELNSVAVTYLGATPAPPAPEPKPEPGNTSAPLPALPKASYEVNTEIAGRYLKESGFGWANNGAYGLGDATGNGQNDLAIVTASGQFLLYEGRGQHQFKAARTIGWGWGICNQIITGYDLDTDGNNDVLCVDKQGLLRQYSIRAGQFTSNKVIGNGWNIFARVWLVPRGANGNPVVYGLASDGSVSAYPTNGRGRFLSRLTIPGSHPHLANAISVGDWDKDGFGDFVSISREGGLIFTPQKAGYALGTPTRIGDAADMRLLAPGSVSAKTQMLYAISHTGKLNTYQFTYSGANNNWVGTAPKVIRSGAWSTHPIVWAGQPTGDSCGPTSMYMVLNYLDAGRSKYDNAALTIQNLRGPRYANVGTGASGGTSWEERRLSLGMNRWLGQNVYTQHSFPSGTQFRDAVINSFNTGRPVVVDTVENYGGPHYNGHFNGFSSHIIVAYRYNSSTGVVGFKDPGGPGSALSGYSAQREFDYPNAVTFGNNFLGNYGGGGHGMVY